MLAVKIKSMTYSNGYTALKNVEFVFPDRGLYFVIGESGSGKSTFLHCMSGMENFDGELSYNGVILSADDKNKFIKDKIGFIFQDYKLFDELSAEDNIMLGAQSLNNPISSEQLKEVIDLTGLARQQKVKTKLLSGGEKQRVALARTLAKDAEIIVADEPTGNLDSKNSANVMRILKDVSAERLVVVVSHDRDSAYKYGDCIIEMCDGTIKSVNRLNDECAVGRRMHVDKPAQRSSAQIKLKYFKLAFVKCRGAKLIATAALTLIVSIFAIIFTLLAEQSKINLTARQFETCESSFAQAVYYAENGERLFVDEERFGGSTFIIECADWQIKHNTADSQETADDEEKEALNIDYCIQQGKDSCGINVVAGVLPSRTDEIAIPVNIANSVAGENIQSILGKALLMNTGVTDKEFVVSAVYDNELPQLDYSDFSMSDGKAEQQAETLLYDRNNAILSRSVVVSEDFVSGMLNQSTAEIYANCSIRCSKANIGFVIYNAEELGVEIQPGCVMFSPFADSALKVLSPNEYNSGNISFNISGTNGHGELKLEKSGVYDISGSAIIVSKSDYNHILTYGNIKYDAIVFDYGEYGAKAAYKKFDYLADAKCYITSSYQWDKLISTIQTVESINLKIMLPLAIVFWLVAVLTAYICIKTLLLANGGNLNVMRILGIGKKTYLALTSLRVGVILLIVGAAAVICAALISLAINSIGLFIPSIFVFDGWEIVGLTGAYLIGAVMAEVLVIKKQFDSPIAQIYLE